MKYRATNRKHSPDDRRLVPPVLLGFARHRRCRRVLDIEPMLRPAGTVRGADALGHDALAAELAGLLINDDQLSLFSDNKDVPLCFVDQSPKIFTLLGYRLRGGNHRLPRDAHAINGSRLSYSSSVYWQIKDGSCSPGSPALLMTRPLPG